MDVLITLGVIAAMLSAVTGLTFIFSENGNVILGSTFLAIGIFYGLWMWNSPWIARIHAEKVANDAAHDAKCAKPRLVAVANGVELWAHNWCNNEPVYFAKSGASWNTEECRMVGKTQQCTTKKHQTPTGE